MERQGTEGTHSSKPQKALPTSEFILWCKMLAVHCFVWPAALQLLSGWLAGMKADENLGFGDFLKNSISSRLFSCF